jgi:hypothetical protein
MSAQIVGAYTEGGVLHGLVRGSTGAFTTFDLSGHLHTALTWINDLAEIAGVYNDTNSFNTFHSFVRDPSDAVTLFDVPGATTTNVGQRGRAP